MPEIGNNLREARIRRGLSIRDVEYVTKIRSKYLEALEDDDFEVLPGPTYVRAFLRTYALFLKLDAVALVDEYREHYEHPGGDPAVLRSDQARTSRSRTGSSRPRSGSSNSRSNSSRSGAAALPKKKRARRNQRGYVLIGAVALVVVFLLAWFGSGRGQKAASIDADNISSSTTSTSSTAVISSTTVPAGTGSSATTTAPTASSTGGSIPTITGGTGTTVVGNVTLVVNVTEGSCWLVVREGSASGAEIYAGTLSAGGQQTFDSSKRYWLLVGRPEALALLVNNATFTLTPPAGSFLVTGTGIERSQ